MPEIILNQLATLAGELMDQMTQQLILDANADEQQKLERLIDTLLTHHKLLVLFDNFEDNQTTDSAIIQPQLTDFLRGVRKNYL